MLKVNKKNKEINKENINNNKKYIEGDTIALIALSVSCIACYAGFMTITTLDENMKMMTDDDFNKAVISMGEDTLLVDIEGYSKNNRIALTDGTIVSLSKKQYKLHNNYDAIPSNGDMVYVSLRDSSKLETDALKIDRAMFSVGDILVAINIKEKSSSKDFATLTLVDNTKVKIGNSLLKTYNKNSKIMKQIENEFSAITADEKIIKMNHKNKYDKALVVLNGQIDEFDISSYFIFDQKVILTLKDGNKLSVDINDFILYNSESSIMDSIKDEIIKGQNVYKR